MTPLSRFTIAVLLAVAVAVNGRADDDHFAWKPPVRPKVPAVRGDQPANPIDAFIRAKLDDAKLTPASPVSREHLIRRVTFDLTGLPPTPDEVNAFVADTSADAWAKVIDRLLVSPRYGERWGRHWLDLARYADSNGYEFDEPRPDAWRYRDYVIRSFNADKPFDRFIKEQIAGDEFDPTNPDARVATGFNLLGPDMTDSADQVRRRLNTLNDMTDTTALVFLGLTLTCARCHDHKFEPISQDDYFRFQAFFTPAAFRNDLPVSTPAEGKAHAESLAKYQAVTKEARDAIDAIERSQRTRLFEAKLSKLSVDAQAAHRTPADKRNGGQIELVAETTAKVKVTDAEVTKAISREEKTKLDEWKAKLKAFDGQKPRPLPVAMGLTDRPGPPAKTYLLHRGEADNRGAEVMPGYPVTLMPDGREEPAKIAEQKASTGRRLTLANWVASADNPLTARVIVNRLWQHHFGRGIVRTSSDFGTRGSGPTHPELLDWLAAELVNPDRKGGGDPQPWTLKRMHKLMVMSQTYQQSSIPNSTVPTPQSKDPDNLLFSRMNRLRLEGEAVRDTLLTVSGRLNLAVGGPGVVLPDRTAASGGAKAVAVTADAKEHTRRSVYLFNRRNLRDPFLEAFDLPDSNLSCPKRERSTTAPQALALLNSDETMTAAKALAERVEKEVTGDGRIDRAYRLTLGRAPTAKELDRAKVFVADAPLSELCRALFNLNEFVYLD